MESNELRLGNLVFFSDENMYFEVNEIYKQGITIIDNKKYKNIGIDLDCFQPILLTEEWLLKFGFKEIVFTQDRNREWFKMFEIEENNELFSLCFYPEKNICYLNFDVGYGNNILNIEFVHQLQNLYFALTQTELTLS